MVELLNWDWLLMTFQQREGGLAIYQDPLPCLNVE